MKGLLQHLVWLILLVVLAAQGWGEEPQALIAQGKEIYEANCAGCHRNNGEGLPNTFPALKGNPFVMGDEVALVRLLLEGRQGKMGRMPAWKNRLNDSQVAAVATFIRNNWGNQAPPVTAATVARERR